MNQRPQHKISNIESDKETMGDSLELIGTGEDFLNRLQQKDQQLINGTPLNLKASARQRTPSFRQSGSLRNDKRFHQPHI